MVEGLGKAIWFGFFELEAGDSTYCILSHCGFVSKLGGSALEVWDTTTCPCGWWDVTGGARGTGNVGCNGWGA